MIRATLVSQCTNQNRYIVTKYSAPKLIEHVNGVTKLL